MLPLNLLPVKPTDMVVELATTSDAVREAQALRHQVFCLERKVFDSKADGRWLDEDAFDARARHIIVRRRSDGGVVATSRVVAGQKSKAVCLPMQRYCCPSLFNGLAMDAVGEISRFAISKQARQLGALPGAELRLGLLSGILRVSRGIGLTHWCALMEPSLIRLLAATGVQFTPVGPKVEAYGQRQPCVTRIDRAVDMGRRSHPHFYNRVSRLN